MLLAANRGAPKNKRLLKLMKETGVKSLVTDVESAFMRDKKLHEIDDRLYYFIDEREHSIALTDLGSAQLSPEEQKLYEIPDISTMLSEVEGRRDAVTRGAPATHRRYLPGPRRTLGKGACH